MAICAARPGAKSMRARAVWLRGYVACCVVHAAGCMLPAVCDSVSTPHPSYFMFLFGRVVVSPVACFDAPQTTASLTHDPSHPRAIPRAIPRAPCCWQCSERPEELGLLLSPRVFNRCQGYHSILRAICQPRNQGLPSHPNHSMQYRARLR